MNNWNRSTNTFVEASLTAFLGTLVIILVAAVLVLIFAWPVQLLWNWLIPGLFNGPMITFWQAAGLQTLSILLLKSSVSVNSR